MTMTGLRPADVCGLCDRPIESDVSSADHHRFLGPGWVHGGGRESIAVHWSCATAGQGRRDLYRVPGWVPTVDLVDWLADWEAQTGPFALKGTEEREVSA